MPKQLSEAAAWRKLAEWCAGHEALLCVALADWERGGSFYDRPPFRGPWEAMHKTVKPMADASEVPCENGWMCMTALADSLPNRDPRVMFCLLMAHECEEEARPTK